MARFLRKISVKNNLILLEPSFTSRLSLAVKFSNNSLIEKSGNSISHEDKFMLPKVQEILRKVTGFEMDVIFKPTHQAKSDDAPPKYKLVTNQQLEKLTNDATKKGHRHLQMPPYLKEREDSAVVISNDSEIGGLYSFKYVFTDISQGLKKRNRSVIIREPDGVLRTSRPEEHDRMMQVYFPEPGKMYTIPSMFTDDSLFKQCLTGGKHLYLLNRLCVQFEPDDPLYIKLRNEVFESIDEMKLFKDLHSTRHFGGVAFHLCSTKNIDGILVYFITDDRIEEAVSTVTLYNILHSDSVLNKLDLDKITDEEVIRLFAQKESINGGSIELALQSYEDSIKNMNNLRQ